MVPAPLHRVILRPQAEESYTRPYQLLTEVFYHLPSPLARTPALPAGKNRLPVQKKYIRLPVSGNKLLHLSKLFSLVYLLRQKTFDYYYLLLYNQEGILS